MAFDGVLVLDKPSGWTSHDVVAKVRRLLGIRKIGHTGTLDPSATGVLVLCVGKATRIAEYIVNSVKSYRGTLRLGITTDTQDADGAVLTRYEGRLPDEPEVRAVMSGFIGVRRQVPPMYSAVKVNGEPLYKSARAGETVVRATRECVIHAIEIFTVSRAPRTGGGESVDVVFDVTCSKGTYVRTLCADMGEALGVGGHLAALQRRSVGRFLIEEAVSLEELARLVEHDAVGGRVFPLEAVLADLPAFTIDATSAKGVRHGMSVPSAHVLKTEGAWKAGARVRLHGPDGMLVAVGIVPWGSQGQQKSEDSIRLDKVLA